MPVYKLVHKLGNTQVKLKFRAKNDAQAKIVGRRFETIGIHRYIRTERVKGMLLARYSLVSGAPLC